MADLFEHVDAGLNGPASFGISVTPSDSEELEQPCRMLWIGSTGDLNVTMLGGSEVSFTNVPDGTLLPIRCSLIKDTGTDADDIVALW